MDSKINRSERPEKRQLGTADRGREREIRAGEGKRRRVKKDSNFSTVEPKTNHGKCTFL